MIQAGKLKESIWAIMLKMSKFDNQGYEAPQKIGHVIVETG